METLTILLSCLIGLCANSPATESQADVLAKLETQAGVEIQRQLNEPFDGRSLSGNYLVSQFAQRHHDWKKANQYMNFILEQQDDNDVELLNKAMILAMGSGEIEQAVSLAKKIVAQDEKSSLALLFMALNSFQDKNYEQAATYISNMPEGSLSEFVLPLLESWSDAANGVYNTKSLHRNSIHLYHAVLISDFLENKSRIESLLQNSLKAQDLSLKDLERVADVYAYIGKKETALDFYEKITQEWPENKLLVQKIEDLKTGKNHGSFKRVESPEHGIAEALYDMARLLYIEHSDDSARVFAHMALSLNPQLTEPHLILAHINARNERYSEAIFHYQKITPDNERYTEARRLAADLYEDMDNIDEALAELEGLFRNYDDLDALIQIGDIYRRNREFGKAIVTYNQATEFLGGTIPKEYWKLHYVRGMSYEQTGQWSEAEADLKAALDYQPDHPLVLNYLGYAWADQGVNLKQSLELIRKAVALQPSDGYITDSLGWVLFRLGKYEEAVPHLEHAVELLPYDPTINDHLGDAYWRVGRTLEARFQWIRAKNHSDDTELVSAINLKLDQGLQMVDIVKEASSHTGDKKILKP